MQNPVKGKAGTIKHSSSFPMNAVIAVLRLKPQVLLHVHSKSATSLAGIKHLHVLR